MSEEDPYRLPDPNPESEALAGKVFLGYAGVVFVSMFLVLPFLGMRVKSWYWMTVALAMAAWFLRIVFLHRRLLALRRLKPELFENRGLLHLPLESGRVGCTMRVEVRPRSRGTDIFVIAFATLVLTAMWVTLCLKLPPAGVFRFAVISILVLTSAGILVYVRNLVRFYRLRFAGIPALVLTEENLSIPPDCHAYPHNAVRFAKSGKNPLLIPWASITRFVIETIPFGSESDLRVYTIFADGIGEIQINREGLLMESERELIDFFRSKLSVAVEQKDALMS